VSTKHPSPARPPARCCRARWSTRLPGRAGRPVGARPHRRAASRRAAAAEVLPRLREATAARTVLASSAGSGHGTVVRHARRDGLDPAHLAGERR
jgi:hypothetical protein